MQRLTAILLLGVLVTIAGCNTPFIDGQQQHSPTLQTESPTSSSTPSPKSSGIRTPFPADINTGEIALQSSDLSKEYDLSSGSLKITANLSGQAKQNYEEIGIIKRHRRSFMLTAENTSGEKPLFFVSIVTLYHTPTDAKRNIADEIADFREINVNTSKHKIIAGLNITKVTFETDTGLKNVVLYSQNQNITIQLVVSGDGKYHEEVANKLFIQMYSDIAY